MNRTIDIRVVRRGQPRPYADHERLYLVKIFYLDDDGAPWPNAAIDMVKQHVLDALGAWRYVQVGERKTGSLGEYAKTYVASCEVTGSSKPAEGVWELEVLICEPYID